MKLRGTFISIIVVAALVASLSLTFANSTGNEPPTNNPWDYPYIDECADAYDVEFCNNHMIEFLGVEATNGGVTWYYRVTNYNEAAYPEISHWITFWCMPDKLIDGEPQPVYYQDEINPANSIVGVKFDEVNIGKGVPTLFWFTLSGNYYLSNNDLAVKFGTNEYLGKIWGPYCGPEIPEFSTIALPALSLVGLFAFFSYRKKKQ